MESREMKANIIGDTHTTALGKLTGRFPRTHELDVPCGSSESKTTGNRLSGKIHISTYI